MISTIKRKSYNPFGDRDDEFQLVPTTRKNRRAISRVVAESTFFGLGHRYRYAKMAGITPARHIEVPDSKPVMDLLDKLLKAGEASDDELKKLRTEINATQKTREEPIYELADTYDEDGMYEALAKVIFVNAPEDFDPEQMDEGVVMEAFTDFWTLRAGMK